MSARQAAIANGDLHYLGAACKRGHSGLRYTVNADCCACVLARQKTPERHQYNQMYQKTERHQSYQQAYHKEYGATSAYKAAKKRYAQANKGKLAAKSRKYMLAKLQRTPAWLTPDDLWLIEQAYEIAALRTKLFGFPWQVDHIFPLHGRVVSGLHVPHNLQVIPGSENRAKSNRYDVA